jgi:CheY-like chemotaxis protein
VVIADDDMDDQFLITRAIEETGVAHSIHIVQNGLELINYLFRTDRPDEVKHQPDLVVMDLNMPLVDGFGALTRIRGNVAFRDVPIYVLSTSRFEYDKVRSRELGATDFFIKPYNFAGLKNIVRDIFTRTVKVADDRDTGAHRS